MVVSRELWKVFNAIARSSHAYLKKPSAAWPVAVSFHSSVVFVFTDFHARRC
jgi:hypothetical protein